MYAWRIAGSIEPEGKVATVQEFVVLTSTESEEEARTKGLHGLVSHFHDPGQQVTLVILEAECLGQVRQAPPSIS